MHPATRLTALVVALLGVTAPSPAQEGVPVAVFEGRGIGHGLGLPLDGAHHLALEEDADADTILERFFPGTSSGSGEGLVRVEVAARDDLEDGIEIDLPDGGVVRDGRRRPVAPSFPVTVPSGGSVRVTFGDGSYRAEVIEAPDGESADEESADEESDSGAETDGESADGAEGTAVAPTPPPAAADTPTVPTTPPYPELGGSRHPIWIEPRDDGSAVVRPEPDGEPRAYEGLVEVLHEAARLHVVNELDVEAYLRGLDLSLPEDEALASAAAEAAVIAARTYALRAASAEQQVGRFHLHADERSQPYAGPDPAPRRVAEAVETTRGRIREQDGEPIAALSTVAAGGRTGAPAEVYGPSAPELDELGPVRYETSRPFRWRVDTALDDLAERTGYSGEATEVRVGDTGPSGRPVTLVVDGSEGPREVTVPDLHRVLRLPSSDFEVRVEHHESAPEPRTDSPPFQELPGEPVRDPSPGTTEPPGGGDDQLPPLWALAAALGLGSGALVLVTASVRHAVGRRRGDDSPRHRHPSPHR